MTESGIIFGRLILTALAFCTIQNNVLVEPQITDDSRSSTVNTISTRLTGFNVPFKIDNRTGSFVEVQLYISRDQGKNWNFYNRQDVSGSAFKFASDGDGEYWFALKTLDRNRQLIPPGNVVNPELRVIVDTKKPTLDFRIDADAAGRINCRWQVSDPNIDVRSMRLEHRSVPSEETGENWIPVEIRPKNPITNNTYNDQIAWWPQTTAPQIEVRFEIADSAGNKATATRTTSVRRVAIQRKSSNSTTSQARHKNRSTPGIVCRDGVCTLPRHNSTPNPQITSANNLNQFNPNGAGEKARRVGSQREFADPPKPDGQLVDNQQKKRWNSPIQGNIRKKPSSIPWESKTSKWTQRDQTLDASTLAENQFPIKPPATAMLYHRYHDVPVVSRSQNPPTSNQIASASLKEQGDLVISESTTIGRGKPLRTDVPLQTNDSAISGNEITRSDSDQADNNDFSLPHSTGRFRPQTVSSDRLTSPTRDRIADAGNAKSAPRLNVNTRRFNLNYDIRAIDPSGVGRVILWGTEDLGRTWRSLAVDPDNNSPFPVEVQSEGTYGFRVVIHSRDGLTGKAPISGDTPDVWVQVDTTRPQVAITSAPYGSGNDVGKLIIHFKANDQFLGLRPIKLSYSPNPQGPWTTIENGLRNSGSYAWKVPSQVPERIFLRIEARDTSNNIGAYQLTSPLDISGLVPRGRIYSVEPFGNSN